MTMEELLRELLKAKTLRGQQFRMDEEIGIETKDGWVSIERVTSDGHGNQLLQPADQLTEVVTE
jgi:hypothetical protein